MTALSFELAKPYDWETFYHLGVQKGVSVEILLDTNERIRALFDRAFISPIESSPKVLEFKKDYRTIVFENGVDPLVRKIVSISVIAICSEVTIDIDLP